MPQLRKHPRLARSLRLPKQARFSKTGQVRNLVISLTTGIVLIFLLFCWLKWGWSHTTLNSLQWVLSALIQAMAIMLGLVLGAYVLMQDRAERSLDHLHRKRSVIARRLLSVLPSVATGFMELRTPDDYWRETHRKVVKLWLALTEMFPEAAAGQQSDVLADTLEITSEWDEKTSMAVAQIVANPVQFLRTLSSVSNLAPFEPGYPHRSILNEYRRDYTAEIGRHIRTIERSHWVCKGPGRLLPILLALSFMWGVLMLSISDKVSTATILWGVSLDMVFAVASLVLFSMVAGRLIQPVGTPSMQSLQRIQTRLTQ